MNDENINSRNLKEATPNGLVFEIVDATDEEKYWPLAIFITLGDALAALELESPDDIPCGDADDWDDHRTIEVRERKIGWGGAGKVVANVEWKGTWDEEADEMKWTRVVPQ